MTPKQYKNLADKMFGEYIKRINNVSLALPYLRMWGDALDMYYISMRTEIERLEKLINGGS